MCPETVANYITIDPATGAVNAEFTGNVRAGGLAIYQPGDLSKPFFGQSRLGWVDQLNPDLTSVAGAFADINGVQIEDAPDNLFLYNLILTARNQRLARAGNVTAQQVQLTLGADGFTNTAAITAIRGTNTVPVSKTLYDSNGRSEFSPQAIMLPRVGCNTQAAVAGAEICRWNFVPPTSGQYTAMANGEGSSANTNKRLMELRLNEVIVTYLEASFATPNVNSYRTFVGTGAQVTVALTAGVNYVVRLVSYSGSGVSAAYTDSNNVAQGAVYKVQL